MGQILAELRLTCKLLLYSVKILELLLFPKIRTANVTTEFQKKPKRERNPPLVCNTSKVLNVEFPLTTSNVTTKYNMAQHKYIVTIYTVAYCLARLSRQFKLYTAAAINRTRLPSLRAHIRTNINLQKTENQWCLAAGGPEGEQTKYDLDSNGSMGC